ncbi:non-ribosomal peptide synthetase [Streptomyces sp. H23]|uniref:non-ribosomal peptide synthetase n=1 Tax=Streptomyces sp. H23 TaxID=2541723 RepID=UPI001431240C|nr:non-ribosomal peptide synthetase [Streptomyces sp. H23]
MTANTVEDAYELSPAQQGILFDSLACATPELYAEQFVCLIKGTLDPEIARAALRDVTSRHPALRTTFQWRGLRRPLQVVRSEAVVDFRGDPSGEPLCDGGPTERLRAVAATELGRGFDLERGPLCRLAVGAIDEEHSSFVFTYHHLVCDGESRSLLLRDFADAYRARAEADRPTAAPTASYRRFVEWTREVDEAEAAGYWRTRLDGLELPTLLPSARTAPGSVAETEGFTTSRHRLPAEVMTGLRQRASQGQVTVNTLVEAAWAILLSRYAGAAEVVFGRTASMRGTASVDGDSVGLFIMPVPVRVDVRGQQPFPDFLRGIQLRNAESIRHERLPLRTIQAALPGVRGSSRLFDSLVVWEDYPDAKFLADLDTVQETEALPGVSYTGFPMTLMAHAGESLDLALITQKPWFDEASTEALLGRLAGMLERLAGRLPQHVWEVSVLDAPERRRVLGTLSGADRRVAPAAPLEDMLTAYTGRTPDAVAVAARDRCLTYAELSAAAGAVAAGLRARGVGPEHRVGVCTERSSDLLVAILGVLFSGAAYVPLDQNYPTDRLAYCAADAAVELVVTDDGTRARLDGLGPELVSVAQLVRSAPAAEPPPTPSSSPDSLAYVLYTSGSTGRPKGVALQRRNAAAFLTWVARAYTREQMAKVVAATSVCFDLSVFELMGPLVVGGTVAIAENALDLDAPHLEGATLLNTVPSALAVLAGARAIPASVATVNVAGEPLTTALAADTHALGHVRELNNLYGPTEGTTYVTAQTVGRDRGDTPPPIGRPITTTTVYLLDADLEPVPLGSTGELYLGGDSVARGYFGRPGLTADRFVPDPFADRPGQRLYRTGDLARAGADGTLDYQGRVDRQVKVRGYRVELGEIEHAALAHPLVTGTVAVPWRQGDGASEVVLYITSDAVDDSVTAALKSVLAARLPAYMMPSAVVTCEAFPLTPNGKIDTAALPRPSSPSSPDEAAEDDHEQLVASAWCSVLGVPSVSMTANFFDIGGNSLNMFQLLKRLEPMVEQPLGIVELYQYPTVRSLAGFLRGTSAQYATTSTPVDRRAALEMLRKKRRDRHV